MKCRALLVAVALSAAAIFWAAPCLAAQAVAPPVPAPPERIALALRNVLWQTLPDGIQAVFVGPDQRLWCQLRYTGPEDLAAIRQRIEREFREKNPQIWGATPILFQAGGRVWFQTASRSNILAYDGHDWVEHVGGVQVNCPNHGRIHNYSYTAEADGTVFFVGPEGVHSFDGKQWAYQQMGSSTSSGIYTRLMPLGDGKTVLAVIPWKGLWQWRGGKWAQVKSPAAVPDNLVGTAAPWPGGGVYVQQGERLLPPTSLRFGMLGADAETDFKAILPLLGDKEFKVREEATARLAMMGPGAATPAEAAMRSANDPEVRERLGRALEAFKPGPQAYATVGPYRLTKPAIFHVSIPGMVFITAEDIQEGDKLLGAGLVVAFDTGAVRAMPGAEIVEALRTYLEGAPDALVVKAGKAVWIGGDRDGRLPQLLDLERGKLVDRGLDPNYYWLQAAQADGRIYLGCGQPWADSGRVGVYTPGAPDDRRLLEAQVLAYNSEVAERSRTFMSPDGVIWAYREGGPASLWKFDDKRWGAVDPPPDLSNLFWLQAGRGGKILTRHSVAGNSEIYKLLADGKVIDSGTIEALVPRHAREIAEAMTGDPEPFLIYEQRDAVRVDKAGNIWVMKEKQLIVWNGKEWLDGSKALRDMGATKGSLNYLSAVGDGSKMYMDDADDFPKEKSALGEIKDGWLVLQSVLLSNDRQVLQMSPRDREGALWVPNEIFRPGFSYGDVPDQKVSRLMHSGVVQELTNSGKAFLCDQGGNVWLGNIVGGLPEDFNLWREGKIVATASIPGASVFRGRPTHMASDRPGSVFACTRSGLVHMVAEDPMAPTAFTVKAIYHVKGAEGQVKSLQYSSRGYLLIRGEVPIPHRGTLIYWSAVVPVPKD